MREVEVNGICEYTIPFNELGLTEKHVESGVGYRTVEAPTEIKRMIREVLDKAAEYSDLRGGFRILDGLFVDVDQYVYVLNGIRFTAGKTVVEQIKKAESAAVFACTMGPRFEAWSKQLIIGGDFVKGYLVDAAASEAVELAMDKIQARLAETVRIGGRSITSRFSPGYCGWPVSDQHKLFSLLPENSFGISLTPSSLMVPIKSVSGIIGIGRDVRFNPYPCTLCELKECFKRKPD
jgi:hypothetical protein